MNVIHFKNTKPIKTTLDLMHHITCKRVLRFVLTHISS